MPSINRQWLFASRPEGAVTAKNFERREGPIPEPGANEMLVRTRMISIAPANRAWMQGVTYRDKLEPGVVMPGSGVAEVVRSNVAGFNQGDIVEGTVGWQDYSIQTAASVRKRDQATPHEALIGVLGGTGLTAYFGTLDVARPLPGETFVVSAAAGAVGSIAAQIGKIAGCRVVGVAGGAEKCAWLVRELGLDAAVDYRSPTMLDDMRKACPDGIDSYFDNTGGAILDAALALMNEHGRVASCGYISQYNDEKPGPGPAGLLQMLVSKRIRMEGFLLMDYFPQREKAEKALKAWHASGLLKAPVHIVEGLDNTPQALADMFAGANLGKFVVRVS
ncbi:MAG: NADP-dependent oxidoreductase [Hyphomonadaceae bacterium]